MATQPESRDVCCSFCGARSPRKLIAGPKIFICDECVARSIEKLGDGNAIEQSNTDWTEVPSARRAHGWFQLFRNTQRPIPPHCNFCGKSPPELVQPPSNLGTRALICGECLRLCQQLIEEELAAQV